MRYPKYHARRDEEAVYIGDRAVLDISFLQAPTRSKAVTRMCLIRLRRWSSQRAVEGSRWAFHELGLPQRLQKECPYRTRAQQLPRTAYYMWYGCWEIVP